MCRIHTNSQNVVNVETRTKIIIFRDPILAFVKQTEYMRHFLTQEKNNSVIMEKSVMIVKIIVG